MKSVFVRDSAEPTPKTPDEFMEAGGKFVAVLRDKLSANEVRALAADKVASPVLQVRLLSIGCNIGFPGN
jgi:nucleolar protein 9